MTLPPAIFVVVDLECAKIFAELNSPEVFFKLPSG